MRINFEAVLDKLNERFDITADYTKSSKKYLMEHGYGCYISNARTLDEKHIAYCYHEEQKASGEMCTIFDVLGMEPDEIERAYSAARALRRWYQDTQWKRCPSDELIDKLEQYVFG